MSRKHVIPITVLIVVMILSLLVRSAATVEPIQNPYELVEDVPSGNGPITVDPAACYDTVSSELIFNVYEPLVSFYGERIDIFRAQLATQVTVGPPAAGSPPYTNFTVYFKVRENVPFHTWSRSDEGLTWAQYYVHPYDIEYSFERMLVHDYVGGPQPMIFEPLLGGIHGADTSDPTFGDKINDTVQSNSTHCWFNLANVGLAIGGVVSFTPVSMFGVGGDWNTAFWSQTASLPLNYPLTVFFQVWAQAWSGIVSYDWTVNWLNPYLAAKYPPGDGTTLDWPGTFNNWTDYCQPPIPIYDLVGTTYLGVTCGTGPYVLDVYDPTSAYSLRKYDAYWDGWPAKWPSPPYPPQISSGIGPQGWVDRFTVRQAGTTTRINDMINGVCDFADIPRARAGNLHVGGNRNGDTLTGVRLDYPIPGAKVDSFHMNFNITSALGDPYGRIYPADELHWDGIPANFFSDKNVRLAFAYAINYTLIIHDLLLDEAYQPKTACVDGLPYVNPAQPKYSQDLAEAANYLSIAWSGVLPSMGFTVHICYNSGNTVRQAYCDDLAATINSLNPNYHAISQAIPLIYYGPAMNLHQLPTFAAIWLPDYLDIQSYMFAYCHTDGFFAQSQGYSSPAVDALLNQANRVPDGPTRQNLYYQVESLYYQDVPSVPLFVTVDRGYMRDWVCGHYYNALYPGIYAYNHWKWNYLTGDVNCDGAVDLLDINTILRAFGSYYGKSGMPVIHTRWNFYADVDDAPRYRWRNRGIDASDVSNALSQMGLGVPNPLHGGSVYLVVEPANKLVCVGDNVSITIDLKSVAYLSCYCVRLMYNASLLELLTWKRETIPGWETTETLDSSIMVGGLTCKEIGLGMYPGSGGTPFSGNTFLVNFTFRGLALGNATLDISKSTLGCDDQSVSSPYNPINGEVEVKLVGDVNEDGKVDMGDLVELCKAFGSTVGPDGHYWHNPPCINCWHSSSDDVDSNGRVDMGDVIAGTKNFGKHYP